MFGCITLLSSCSSPNDELSGGNTNSSKKEDVAFPYYGKFKIVQTADVQQAIGSNNSIHENDIVIVQDEVTGCMYVSNNSSHMLISPLYDETGKVRGCGKPIE